MEIEQLYILLGKAMEENPDIKNFKIYVDSELDTTMKLGIFRNRKLILILNEDSYLKTAGMTVYE